MSKRTVECWNCHGAGDQCTTCQGKGYLRKDASNMLKDIDLEFPDACDSDNDPIGDPPWL